MRVALGQLPVGSVPALAAVLRPSTPRSPRWSKKLATDALAVAAQQLPQGTFAASALSAAAGRAILRVRDKSPKRHQGPLLADALAVAAQQQPQGTSLACTLAAAAGRAFLRLTGNPEQRRSRALAGSALAVAAKTLSQEYASAILPASRQQSAWLRHTGSSCRQTGSADKFGARDVDSTNLIRGFAFQSLASPVASAQDAGSSPRLAQGNPASRLCQDTSSRVIGQLWPEKRCAVEIGGFSTSSLSPRTCETRLRHSRPLLMDLSRVSAVSPSWARHAEKDGWPSTHVYLFQASGTKMQLQERYNHSMQKLLLKDQLRGFSLSQAIQGGVDSLVNRIAAFVQ